MSTTATRTPISDHDRCHNLVERISQVTGHEWTFGYIGNCGVDQRGAFDDRSWYAFRAHPGRVGTHADRLGGVATEELDKLTVMLGGALKLARMTT